MEDRTSGKNQAVRKDGKSLFGSRPQFWGMLHSGALPVTPKSALSPDELVESCLREAEILVRSGVDGLILENMHDLPYASPPMGPEVVANMTRLCNAVRKTFPDLPVGLQILAAANREAMAVAHACALDFIRVEGYVFAHIADEGWTDSSAADLMRYRRALDAEHVRVFADIKKKHSSHSLTSDISLPETAKAAEFFLADGLIVTGNATGEPASAADLAVVRESCSLPVMIGSGINPENVRDYWDADAFIVGSYLKTDGDWRQPVDPDRVKKLRDAIRH